MQAYIIWFIAAFIVIGAELLAGTFYLLVVGIGLAVGGVAALLNLDPVLQILIAALIAVGGTVILRRTRAGAALRKTRPAPSLDIGQTVQVVERRPDGSLRVNYRGTQWEAESDGTLPDGPVPVTLYIRALRGTKLIVAAQPA